MSKLKKIGDLGTPERHARKELTKEIVNGQKVARVRKKQSYEILYSRKTISYEQKLAAEKIEDIYINSQPRHNCEYREPISGGKKEHVNDRQLHYQDLFNKSLAQLNTLQKTLIIHVVINDNPLINQSMNPNKKKERRELIRSSLTKLAQYYNYI